MWLAAPSVQHRACSSLPPQVRKYHLKYSMSSRELLAQTSRAQAVSLMLLGPFIDRLITGRWLWDEQSNVWATSLVLLSCVLALATNWTQFACLRRFPASTFQVRRPAEDLGQSRCTSPRVQHLQLRPQRMASSGPRPPQQAGCPSTRHRSRWPCVLCPAPLPTAAAAAAACRRFWRTASL